MPSLAQRHRVRQQQLADVVARRLAAMLGALPDLEQEHVDAYTEAAFPVVRGGQERTMTLAAAFAAAATVSRRIAPLAGALEHAGVAVERDSRSLVAPVLRARHLVAEGSEFQPALASAGAYAGQLSSNDLQVAQHVGLEQGAPPDTGWVKELAPDCCDWCQLVGAERIYNSPESVPFHDNDKCSVSPA